MYSYIDIVLSVMQRVEVYNEIFNGVYNEVQENSNQAGPSRKGKDTYVFCCNNVNRFLTEEAAFRKNLQSYGNQEATNLLLQGLEKYRMGVYFLLAGLTNECEIKDATKFQQGLQIKEESFRLINQACKEACGGIESAHSVHKM